MTTAGRPFLIPRPPAPTMKSAVREIYERRCAEDSDIQGHLPVLYDLAFGQILEIGVRYGFSTAALLLAAEETGGHLYSVDVDNSCAGVFKGHDRWTFIHGHSYNDRDRIKSALPPRLNTLFIDGDHGYETVMHELNIYAHLLDIGGVIMLHDVDLQGAGVRRAITEFHEGLRGFRLDATLEFREGSYGLGILKLPGYTPFTRSK